MKASFKPEYQDETGICGQKDARKTQFRMKQEESGYHGSISDDYPDKAPHGGKSFVKGKAKQYGNG